ncbi:MAG: hypothetical protein KDA96_17365, partial [Planctomycetaceae bacterium]|nr:hypothetical protein [Planctomycetaceae bacterium]
ETGTLTVGLNMELTNRQFPQDLQLRLPRVETATIQTGDLDLLIPPGLQARQEQLSAVQRRRVTTEPDAGVAATAYRMKSADSEIRLHLEEIEALFAVSPELVFKPDGQNVVMTVRLPVNVLRGSLLDLPFRWPGYSRGLWQILPGSMRLQYERPSENLPFEQAESDPESLLVKFPERLSGQFVVEFKAYAPIPSNPEEAAELTLTCPEVESRSGRSVVVVTIESDEYSIIPHSATEQAPLAALPFRSVVSEELQADGDSVRSWLHDQPRMPLRLEMIPQAPSITSSLQVGLTPQPAGIEVRETIEFLIEHRDLTQLQLTVPDGIRPIVRLKGSNERLRETAETANRWSYRLPRAQRGRLSVEVSYLWGAVPRPDMQGGALVQVPLILPTAAESLSCEVGTDAPDGLTISDDRRWQPIYSDQFAAAWQTDASVAAIPIRWTQPVSVQAAGTPDVIACRSIVASGQAATSTVVVFESMPGRVVFTIPSGCTLESVTCGDRPLNGSLRRQSPGTSTERVSETTVSTNSEDRELAASENAVDEPDISVDPSPNVNPEPGITWSVSPETSDRPSSGPFMMELRIRQKLPLISGLSTQTQLLRPVFEAGSGDVPLLWSVESDNSLRSVQTNPGIARLSTDSVVMARLLGQTSVSVEQLPGILAVFPSDISQTVHQRLQDWQSDSLRHEVFLTGSRQSALNLIVIPTASLLLVTAVVCLTMFVVMTVFRRISLLLGLVSGCTLIAACVAMFPEWGAVLGPALAVGLAFALLAMVVQRIISSRRVRYLTVRRSTEMPTVFGIPGILSDASLITRPGDPGSESGVHLSSPSVSSAGA